MAIPEDTNGLQFPRELCKEGLPSKDNEQHFGCLTSLICTAHNHVFVASLGTFGFLSMVLITDSKSSTLVVASLQFPKGVRMASMM